ICSIRKYFELKVEVGDNIYFMDNTTSEDNKKNVKASLSDATCLTDMRE
ncbi:unnamed protein product, partial [Adineta steineri]